MKRPCDVCGSLYQARQADLNRGWALTCSKSCAAKKREQKKPWYNKSTVESNNRKRREWNNKPDYDHEGWQGHKEEYR